MDPTAAWTMLTTLVPEIYRRFVADIDIQDDLDDATQLCESLSYWYQHSGFPPAGMTRTEALQGLAGIVRGLRIVNRLS